jgi:DNA processing protein
VASLKAGSRRGGSGPDRTRRIRRGDPEYPDGLTHLAVPPEILWARGPVVLGKPRTIAIVGTRKATEYGRRMAHDLAFDLATRGWTIVSGLARGIDSAAHRGALAAQGRTIAVLGCGIDHVYPVRNRELREEIAATGLLVSEYEPAEPPLKFHFPERNRIIAALGRAVVVVQAGERSGALITAGMALELGREVLAVPGPADQPGSRGVNRLLRDGAGLVETATDVIDSLSHESWREGTRAGDGQPTLFDDGQMSDQSAGGPGRTLDRLEALLATGPVRVDELARAMRRPVSETLAELGRLELSGVVRSLPGQRFERVGR